MKKLSIFLLAIVAILSLSACSEEDDFTFVAQPDPEGISFTNTFLDSYVLKSSNGDNLGERFVWNSVDFDAPTTIRYELQGSTDATFESPSILGSNIAETNYAVTVAEMMALASEAGLDNDPATDAPNSGMIYFRVRAYAGESVTTNVEQLSEATTLNVELAENTSEEVVLPMVYMVGNFQSQGGYGSDWTPADGVALTASDLGKTDFEGYVYVNADAPEFKFLPTNEGWDGDYGDAGATNGVYTGVLVQEGESNAGTPDGTGGYYLVKVDTDALTYSLDPFSWGLIGDATTTGWDADTDMTYDTNAHVWTITMNLIGGNKIKFRANDGWDVNVGDNDGDGTAEFGGSDIVVPEDGEYTVTLDLTDSRNPEYTLTKN